MTEQYIVRELKQDIKYLIKRVTELEKKLEEAHPSPSPKPIPDWITRHSGYREWDKTHDNYKVIHSPSNTDEHGKKIKDD